MSNWYRVGTVSVTNGSATVTGAGGTGWISQVKAGDLFFGPDGKSYEIASDPTINTSLTLATAYQGTTLSGQAYAIARFSDGWRPTAELSLRIANFLSSVTDIFSGSGAPSAGLGGDGSVYFRQDVPEYYFKTGSTWGSPISLIGPSGPSGAAFATTSTTGNSVGTGAKTFTVPGSGTDYLGSRMRAASTASPTNYLEGIVTAATSTSVTINADRIGGSGTFSAWSLVVAGDVGLTGATGASFAATSATSNAIGTGTKTFATQTGLAYVANASRVRVASAANAANYMAGVVTAYSGGSMSVAVDETGGSGTFADWVISIAGSRGLAGTNGTSFSWLGAYNSASTYAERDHVSDQGSSWIAIAAVPVSTPPPTLPTEFNAYWQLTAKKGTDGTGTINSVNGNTGPDVMLDALQIEINALNPANYTETGTSVEAHLEGIDGALATLGINDNLLINPDGRLNQRAAASIADGAYGFDRWYALTQTAAIAVSAVTDAQNGYPALMRLTQSNATAQRMGHAQVIEAAVAKQHRGGNVNLSGALRCSAAATIRYAVLEWTGTADTITRDVVLSWTSTSFVPGGFFVASNVAVAASGSIALAANTITEFSLPAAVSASANNLIVFIWSDAVLSQNVTLDFRAKLEPGQIKTKWINREATEENMRASRFFQRLKPIGNSAAAIGFRLGATFVIGHSLAMRCPMRSAPSITTSSPTWAAAAPAGNNQIAFRQASDSTYVAITGALTITFGAGHSDVLRSIILQAATSFGGTAGNIGEVQIGATAYFDCDAEL